MSTRPIYIFILFILVIGVNTEHTHAQTCTHVLSFFFSCIRGAVCLPMFFHIKMNIYTSKQRKCDTLIASSFPMTSSICRQTFHFLVYLTDGMSSCGPFEGFEGTFTLGFCDRCAQIVVEICKCHAAAPQLKPVVPILSLDLEEFQLHLRSVAFVPVSIPKCLPHTFVQPHAWAN